MKKKTIEKWVLLEQSGELSGRKKQKLDACPEAKVLRDELNVLCEALSSDSVEPSPWATTKIQARLRGEHRSVLLPARVWTPIVAMAACLMLMVSVWDVKPDVPPVSATVVMKEVEEWNMQFDQELVELESLIFAMSNDSMELMEM